MILRLSPGRCKYEEAEKMLQICKWNRKKLCNYIEGVNRTAAYWRNELCFLLKQKLQVNQVMEQMQYWLLESFISTRSSLRDSVCLIHLLFVLSHSEPWCGSILAQAEGNRETILSQQHWNLLIGKADETWITFLCTETVTQQSC